MTSKERVRAVFNKEIPDRIPMWCGASPEFMEKAEKELRVNSEEEVLRRFHDDFRRVYSRYVGPDRNGKSDFGVERHGIGYGPVSYTHLEKTCRLCPCLEREPFMCLSCVSTAFPLQPPLPLLYCKKMQFWRKHPWKKEKLS